MNPKPMRICLLLIGCFLGMTSRAQLPDSVRYNGSWYYVYPKPEKAVPDNVWLKIIGLSEKQYLQLVDWKVAGDPRANLPKKQLIDSLNAELVRSKQVLTKTQDINNWEAGTEPPFAWRSAVRYRKYWYRKKPGYALEYANQTDYDLIPTVTTLPDGKYIQYFSPILTCERPDNTQLITGHVAAVFSIKDNLPEGEFTRFTFYGDTLRHGFFADGLKEGMWLMSKEINYTGGRKRGEQLPGAMRELIRVELKGGVPNGNFCWINEYHREQLTGNFIDGIAVGEWENVTKYGEKERYTIIPAATWLEQKLTRITVSPNEWIRKADGFDMAEMTGRNTPYLYTDALYVPTSCTLEPLKPVSSFESLYKDPISSRLTRNYGKLVLRDENGHELKALRFAGSWEHYSDNQLVKRWNYDTVTGALTFAHFYENGKLFDTLSYSASEKLFHYQIFDCNGRLYLDAELDKFGNYKHRVLYAQQKAKRIKPEKEPETRYVEGVPTVVVNKYFSGNRRYYYWENEAGTLHDGLLYKEIYWNYKSDKRVRASYWKNDTLHELQYDFKGKLVSDLALVKQMVISEKGVETARMEQQSSLLIWDDCAIAVPLNTQPANAQLLWKGEPFTGKLTVRFTRRKVRQRFRQRTNELTLWVSRYSDSRAVLKRFPEGPFGVKDDHFLQHNFWIYRSDQAALLPHLNALVGDHLLHTLNQEYISGPVAAGQLSGNWIAKSRNGKINTHLQFQSGIPSGTVGHYEKYNKPDRFDRRWAKYNRYYYQEFSKKRIRYYLKTLYSLENNRFSGAYIYLGPSGDLLSVRQCNENLLNGPMWITQRGDTLTGAYKQGLADGPFTLYEMVQQGPQTVCDTLVHVVFSNGELNGPYEVDFSYLEYRDEYSLQSTGRLQQRTRVKKYLKGAFSAGELHGPMTIIDAIKGPEIRVVFNKSRIDSVLHYENGEVSWYFDRFSPPPLATEGRINDSITVDLQEISLTDRLSDVAFRLVKLEENLERDYDANLSWVLKELNEQNEGYLTKLYPNGNIARTGYRNGTTNYGMWRYYNYAGHLLYTIHYGDTTLPKGIIGLYSEYDSTGTLLSKRYVTEEVEKYDCAHSDYYAIRQFVVIEDRADNTERMNGLQRNYFDNGTVMSEGTLKNGVPDGVWKFYTPDGRLTRVGRYSNGNKEGRWLIGDLGDKKYIGEICLNPDDPFLDFHIAELERQKDIEVRLYRNGELMIRQYHE